MAGLISCSIDPRIEDFETLDIKKLSNMENMINGVYYDLSDYKYMGQTYIIIGEVMADNVYSNGAQHVYQSFSRMQVKSTQTDRDDHLEFLWKTIESSIGKANIIINFNLNEIADSEAHKDDINHILGEAYAIRAMAHFDLVRLFGQRYIDNGSDLGIPYMLEYKPKDLNVPRESIDQNIKHIYDDIEIALDYMNKSKSSQLDSDKTRFTEDAVFALKARVGTFFKDYSTVRDAAEKLLGKYSLVNSENYVDYWKEDSPGAESIFELYKDPSEGGSPIAGLYRSTPSAGDIQVFDNIFDDAKFGPNDVRASDAMIGFDVYQTNRLRNLGKYPSMGTELGKDNIKVFRYSEVLLNYAEALLDTDLGKSLDILNEVASKRDGVTYSNATLDNILEERRKELMFEGFRFFDLARTGKDVRDMGNAANNHGFVEAGDDRYALPFPQHEIDSNQNLEQNPGY